MEIPPCKKLKLTISNRTARSEVFNVQLHCTKTNLTEKGEITLELPPQDILDVKKQVEKQFSIPACVQAVSYNGHTLKNDIKLSALRVRGGDTFCVKYLAKGNCADLKHIISWLGQLSNAMAGENSDLNDIVETGIQESLLEMLPELFSPWDDPTSRTYVNKLFLIDNGGIGVILKVYEFLLQKEWKQMDENFKYLECYIIVSLWSFAETFPLRRLLIQHNIIRMLTQSLLRVRLEEGRRIYEYDTSGNQYEEYYLEETLCGSVGVFAK